MCEPGLKKVLLVPLDVEVHVVLHVALLDVVLLDVVLLDVVLHVPLLDVEVQIHERLENKNIKTTFSPLEVDMGLPLRSSSCEH